MAPEMHSLPANSDPNPSDVKISVGPEVSKGVEKSTGGSGLKWADDLNELIVKPGGNELAKLFVGVTFSGTLVLLFGCLADVIDTEKQLRHPVLFPVIAVLVVLGFIFCLTAIVVYRKNWTRVSAVTGVMGIACGISLPPIAMIIFLPKVLLVFVWICYPLCLILMCRSFLCPSAAPDLTKEDGVAPPSPSSQGGSDLPKESAREEVFMSFPSFQSGETASEADVPSSRMGTVDAMIVSQSTVITTEIQAAEDVKANETTIRTFAVICFINGTGSNPPLWIMKDFFTKVWGNHGIANISMMPDGSFIVEFFHYYQALEAVEGSRHRTLRFEGQRVFTKLWEPIMITPMKNKEEVIDPVLIWITLPGVDLKSLSPSCLNALAGDVGKPLKFQRGRFNSARILVEVNKNQQLPDWFYFEDEAGSQRKQKVTYVFSDTSAHDCSKRSAAAKNMWIAKPRGPAVKKVWVVKPSGPAVVAPNIY